MFFFIEFIFFFKLMILLGFGMFEFVTDKNISKVRMIKVQDIGLIWGIKTYKLNFDIIIFYFKLKF